MKTKGVLSAVEDPFDTGRITSLPLPADIDARRVNTSRRNSIRPIAEDVRSLNRSTNLFPKDSKAQH